MYDETTATATTTEQDKDFVLLLEFIDPAKVERVYSGKPGCGCGCRGTYWSDQKNARRVLKAMQENIDAADRAGVQTSGDQTIAFVETPTRYYWAYLSQKGGAA